MRITIVEIREPGKRIQIELFTSAKKAAVFYGLDYDKVIYKVGKKKKPFEFEGLTIYIKEVH